MDTTINAGGNAGTTVAPDTTSTGGPSGVQNATPASTTTTPPASTTPDWTSGIPAQNREYVIAKGFKDVAALTESYRNLESVMGAPKERILKLPENISDAKSMGDVYDRLGRPKTANEYTFTSPKGATVSPEFTPFVQKLFYDAGLSKEQGEKIASGWNEYAAGNAAVDAETKAANLGVEKTALAREWGAASEQNIKAAGKAAQTFGLDKEALNKLEGALGYSATMKFLQQIGSKVGEDTFVGGNQAGFQGALTPERAQAQIKELTSDKAWNQKYLTGDHEAKKKMESLMRMAYPDMDNTGIF